MEKVTVPFTLPSIGDALSVREALLVVIARLEYRDSHRTVAETVELRALEQLVASLSMAIEAAQRSALISGAGE